MMWDLVMYEGWVGDGQIVLNEPGEELRHIRAVSGDGVLAHVAGLQAVQVACECGRECWWHLHRVSPPAVTCSEYACFSALVQTRNFAHFGSYNQGKSAFY